MDGAPILVTGSHRGGTTFVGRMLALSRDIAYIHEPLHPAWGIEGIDRTLPYTRAGDPDEPPIRDTIERLLSGRARFRVPPELPWFRRLPRQWLGAKPAWLYWRARTSRRRWLIKDPFAAFLADYLRVEFGMRVVIVVRHPAAFVASVKRMGWSFDFKAILSQPRFVDRHLQGVLRNQRPEQLDEVTLLGLLWMCVNQVFIDFASASSDVVVVRHEDLALSPMVQFARLFDVLGLPFTPSVKSKLRWYTSTAGEAPGKKLHELRRNSATSVDAWKRVLSSHEITGLRDQVGEFASRYYPASSWGHA